MQTISVKEVEYIAFRLAREMMSFNEPIPDFSTRFPNMLESCLATPFQTFSGKSLYPNLISKASILFYLGFIMPKWLQKHLSIEDLSSSKPGKNHN